MPRRASRRQQRPSANRNLQLVSYLLTFVFGFAAGLGSARMTGVGQSSESPPSSGAAQPSPDQAAAIRQLETHLSHAPDDINARIQLGNLYFDTGRFESAIIQYGRALEIQPENPDVIVDQGIAYRRVGQSDVCIRKFREALTIDPAHVNARYNLGLVLQADFQDYAGAIAAWDTLLTQTPDHPRAGWIREQLAQMRRQTGS